MWTRLRDLLRKHIHRTAGSNAGGNGLQELRHPRAAVKDETVVWRFQSLFNNFRRILDQNNAALAKMADMERALGGEYIFDQAFLESSVRQLTSLVHHVAYNLNALTRNAHVALYPRFQEIGGTLNQILAGTPPSASAQLCIPFDDITWELEPEAGLAVVCLAELRRQARIRVMDGFVITTTACRALLEQSLTQVPDGSAAWNATDIGAALVKATEDLVRSTGAVRLSVSVVALDHLEEASIPQDRQVAPQELPSAVAQLLLQGAAALAPESASSPSRVIVVQEGFATPLYGEVYARCIDDPRMDLLRVVARRLDAPEAMDRYLLRRAHPFDLLLSEVAAHPADDFLPDGLRPAQRGASGLLRGSALLTVSAAKALAEVTVILERLFGVPCVVRWGTLAGGTIAVQGITAQHDRDRADLGTDLAAKIAKARVLCRGGQTVQSGVAAGGVVHVTEDFEPRQFPAGAIAVARSASPRLTPVLQRAAALLTEVGTAAGHLATVARELRVPAVFGMPNVLRALPQGTSVTVDAVEAVVYDGVIDDLLLYGAAGGDLYPTDPEYRLLRRLLRFILPLNLVDPKAPDFEPDGCRTLHDILHYCHERAVDELAHLQERQPGLAGLRTRRLEIGVPMQIGVLDIGGGLSAQAGPRPGIADIHCEPLAAFVEGLCRSDAWNTGPAVLGVGEILSGTTRSLGALNAPAESLAGNLGIAGRDYLNLSLRLGYHFSVIDAYLGPDPQRSYVYFRFAGGFADAARRNRRAGFIRDVLAALDFNVSQSGDLVVGRLKLVAPHSLRAALVTLGALTAYTRQRDTELHADSDRQALYAHFAEAFLPADIAAKEGAA
jgi:pyruvate, water dikinase